MTYKVIDIEGVGEVYAEKLIAAGIKTDAELLEKCAKPAGRKALAEATEISPKLILKWANHCDLYRINGVGPQFAELLEASGMHPEAAIDLVTTPGGVTIKGLNEMEHAGFTSAVIRGLKAGLK